MLIPPTIEHIFLQLAFLCFNVKKLPNTYLNYPALLNRAMRTLVRECLLEASEHGLTQDHHFFISFITRYPDVLISDKLLQKYPQEITIVLQYQFKDLEVLEDKFRVRLSFDGIEELVQVPFHAISSFADPSQHFAIQLQPEAILDSPDSTAHKDDPDRYSIEGNVITLNQFRKKNT